MTTEHTYTKLRLYDKTCAGLIADPDAKGDLLLIGLWLARATILRDPPSGEGRWSFDAISVALWGETYRAILVKDVIRRDSPRYDPFVDNPRGSQCGAPMLRAPFCRRSVMTSGFATDPLTGRRVGLSVCGRRDHQAWYSQKRDDNKAALEAAGDTVPTPAANAGGVLERHIRGIGWAKLYAAVDSRWKPPAEGSPSRKPTLSVLRNDDFEPVAAMERPSLVVHQGSWR